jgi:hypothetical protein
MPCLIRWFILLELMLPAAARAQARYNIQALVKSGDPVGSFQIADRSGNFTVLGLGDSGRIDFMAATNSDTTEPRLALIEDNAPGRLTPLYRELDPLANLASPTFDVPAGDANSSGPIVVAVVDANQKRSLIQVSGGKPGVIATEGDKAPGGQWLSLDTLHSLMMNQRGNTVFYGLVGEANGAVDSGVFRWDAGTQQVIQVAAKGSRAGASAPLDLFFPFGLAINNQGEITFTAGGMDSNGKPFAGLYLRDRSGSVRAVVMDDQALPNGDKIASVTDAVLDDNGAIAFQALRKSDVAAGVYGWENGSVTATGIIAGTPAPGGGTFARIDSLRMNPKDGSLLVAAALADDPSGLVGLYRFAAGQLSATVIPGQTMPDGAVNAGPANGDWQFSPFNAAGQVVFTTGLADGSRAAYRMDTDGTLTLLLKTGMSTSLGTITQIGPQGPPAHFARFPIGLNNQGQIALRAALMAGDAESDALFLLTPQ